MKIFNYIKTDCGRSKYYLLKSRKGFLNKIRFYIFVIAAIIVDWRK